MLRAAPGAQRVRRRPKLCRQHAAATGGPELVRNGCHRPGRHHRAAPLQRRPVPLPDHHRSRRQESSPGHQRAEDLAGACFAVAALHYHAAGWAGQRCTAVVLGERLDLGPGTYTASSRWPSWLTEGVIAQGETSPPGGFLPPPATIPIAMAKQTGLAPRAQAVASPVLTGSRLRFGLAYLYRDTIIRAFFDSPPLGCTVIS